MSDIAFEDGHRVPVGQFDYEQFDVEIMSVDRAKYRKEFLRELYASLSSFPEMLITESDPRLLAWCLRFALQQTQKSEQEIGKMFGVTKAAVSKRVVNLCEILMIPHSRGMRSDEARKTFSKVQKCNYKKRQETKLKSGPSNEKSTMPLAVVELRPKTPWGGP